MEIKYDQGSLKILLQVQANMTKAAWKYYYKYKQLCYYWKLSSVPTAMLPATFSATTAQT